MDARRRPVGATARKDDGHRLLVYSLLVLVVAVLFFTLGYLLARALI